MTNTPLIDKFYSKVIKTEFCWVWGGLKNKLGYGRFCVGNGLTVKAHRWIYEYYYGLIPKGLEVCHKCDFPSCIRFDHLWLGTHAQNMADASQKGRMPKGETHWAKKYPWKYVRGKAHWTNVNPSKINRGIDRPTAKLKEKNIDKIHQLTAEGKSQTFIAKQFGVNQSVISRVLSGKVWKHLGKEMVL